MRMVEERFIEFHLIEASLQMQPIVYLAKLRNAEAQCLAKTGIQAVTSPEAGRTGGVEAI